MKKVKRLKLKKYNFHPITSIIIAILFVALLSLVLSIFKIKTSYKIVDPFINNLKTRPTYIKNVLNYNGLRLLVSGAIMNVVTFKPFMTLLITLIGIAVAETTGYLDVVFKRTTKKMNNWWVTFIVILIATISSIIGDVGYPVLIPIAAILFLKRKRNPLLGIVAAYCGVAFGYGTSLFVSSIDTKLVQITQLSANLIDKEMHIALLSNLFIMIVSSIAISIIGAFIIEGVVAKKIGKYLINENPQEEEKIVDDAVNRELEKRGLRLSRISLFVLLLIYIYMIVPNLPQSGLLLDMTQTSYVYQLFGPNAYLENSFPILIMIGLVVAGINYGIGAKTIKKDKQLYEKAAKNLSNLGYIFLVMFFFIQFVVLFKETKLDLVIASFLSGLINSIGLQGIPLVILSMIFVGIAGIFLPSTTIKWVIFSPTITPLMAQSNISPQFSQFVFRAADSMTKGLSVFLGGFIIYLIYLNIYNTDDEPVTIGKALSYVFPYAIWMSVAWIAIIIFWYLLGLPIGPNVYPLL